MEDKAGYYDSMDEGKLMEGFEAVSKLIWGISSAIQEAIDEAGLPLRGVVAGKHDVKKLRDKLKTSQTKIEDHDDEQSRLDDFLGGEG